MCMAKPNIPEPPPPPQEAKTPDQGALRDAMKRGRQGMATGTLLTGPGGVASAPTGKSTLLGQ